MTKEEYLRKIEEIRNEISKLNSNIKIIKEEYISSNSVLKKGDKVTVLDKKANKARRLVIAGEAGYESAEEYQKYLESKV